jgi:PAS domain S-box-containing protein
MTHSVDSALGDRATFESGALNVLLEAMQDPVVITTVGLNEPGPVITFVNKAFERMTGYTRSEVIGQTPRMFQGPETSRSELERMRHALEAGQTFEGQTVNYRKDGAPFLLGWAVVPIFDDFSEHVAWLSLQAEHNASTTPNLAARATELESGFRENRS